MTRITWEEIPGPGAPVAVTQRAWGVVGGLIALTKDSQCIKCRRRQRLRCRRRPKPWRWEDPPTDLISPCFIFTLSPCFIFTLSLFHSSTTSLSHSLTLSLFLPVALLISPNSLPPPLSRIAERDGRKGTEGTAQRHRDGRRGVAILPSLLRQDSDSGASAPCGPRIYRATVQRTILAPTPGESCCAVCVLQLTFSCVSSFPSVFPSFFLLTYSFKGLTHIRPVSAVCVPRPSPRVSWMMQS